MPFYAKFFLAPRRTHAVLATKFPAHGRTAWWNKCLTLMLQFCVTLFEIERTFPENQRRASEIVRRISEFQGFLLEFGGISAFFRGK
jgi:hypothetical protein